MKATDAQVSYVQRLIQTGIQSGWMPKKDAPDKKMLKKLNQNEISVLIDGLKKKRGTPTFYGNGKFRGFDKKAAGWRKAPGKQNPRPAKTFDEWYILFDHPRLADYQWTALGGLKPGYKMRKLQTFKTPAEAERVIVTKVLDHILDYKTDFGEFITGWVNPSRTATDNDSAVAQRLLGFILAVMRAAQQSHWTAHWQVQGTSFYGDHQMFERFYGELTEQIDALAEKLVAMHGEQAVNLPEQMRWQAYLAHEWDRHDDDDLYYRAYHIEKFLQDHFLKTYEALKHLKQLTLGLDDYLMATANAHETNQYLLGQRIGGRLMTAAGRLKYQVSLFSDKPGARALWTKTFYSTDDARADQEALRLVKPILKKHDDAEDWVVEPIGHKGKKVSSRVAAAEPLVSQADNRKGWFVIEAGGDIASVTQALNAQMVRRVPPPQQVVKVRGTHKAFSFHWSNAQAQWDVIMVREFPWGIDGAEFFVFTTKAAKSPLGKTWSLAEMRYVAKGLNKHPGYAQSPESARRAEFMPDVNDPNRSWEHIGGDLEASYDGAVYIDIRPKGGGDHMFVSKAALVEAMNLFPATGKAALRTASLWRAAAQVGTDTAAIYALAPEQLQRLIEGGRWLEEWATSPGSPASDKLAAAGVPRDWHEKFDDGKNNGWKGQIGLLISLLGKMDVPKQRQEIRLVPNLRWVSRNLQIENKDHKDFKRAQGLVRDLMKQVGRAERSKKARSLAAKWIGKKAAPKSIPAIPSRIIPQGVSGWQLYDTAGASTAARKMTTRMENNLKSVGRNVRPEYSDAKNAKALAGIVRKMYGVLERRTQWGATDTEPRNEMYSTFEKYLKTYLDQWDFPKTFAVLGG